MVATILSFPLPEDHQPAQQRPDDRERIMDRRMLYDEPGMRDLIASLDESSRSYLLDAANRERSRLPLFPAHFTNWDSEHGRFDVEKHFPFYSGTLLIPLPIDRLILISLC
jgi:hypothetical protein